MQVVYDHCAVLDVHKKTVSAGVSLCEDGGGKRQQVRVFRTFTHDLLALADWLKECGTTHVAWKHEGLLATGLGDAGRAVGAAARKSTTWVCGAGRESDWQRIGVGQRKVRALVGAGCQPE